MTKRTYLFIDGSNLYAGQYELLGPGRYLNFPNFIAQIEKKIRISFEKIYFYASYSPQPKKPTKKQKLYLKNEGLFYKSVKQTSNTIFFKGYRSKTSGKEKEVDVKLAVDIVDFAHLNRFDKLFLCSGDADFMHALYIAKRLGKKITILALQNRVPVRFTFNYQTYLISLNGFKGLAKTSPQQRIMTISIDKINIIKKV